jgi:hypothetical protein
MTVEIDKIDSEIKECFAEINAHNIFLKKQAALMNTLEQEKNQLSEAIIKLYKQKCKLLEEKK